MSKLPVEESLRLIRTVTLPLGRAVTRSARQNFERDVRAGLVRELEWADMQEEYESEARAILMRDGQNYSPEYPHTEHILLEPKKK